MIGEFRYERQRRSGQIDNARNRNLRGKEIGPIRRPKRRWIDKIKTKSKRLGIDRFNEVAQNGVKQKEVFFCSHGTQWTIKLKKKFCVTHNIRFRTRLCSAIVPQ